MKKQIVLIFAFLCLGSVTVFFAGCDSNEPLGVTGDVKEFDLSLFEQNLRAAFNDRPEQNRPVGWTYVINKNGQFFSADGFGMARIDADAPAISFSEDKVINVASITKFFTAIAVLQLLERRNLTIDSKIMGWLPDNWNLNAAGISNLSFRDLLTHKSGLQSTNTNFSQTLCFTCLQGVINTGVVGNKNTYNYLNANFALFRILIPSLWRGLPGGPSLNETLTDAMTQANYIQYLQEKAFTPAGVANADCVNESVSVATMYYRPSDNVNPVSGVQYTNWTSLSGGGGYYLTAVEIARVLAQYEHTETLLSNATKSIMKENRIGFDPGSDGRELHGPYYGKNGSIIDANNRGVLAQTFSFPVSKVEVVVLLNTQILNFPNGNSFSGIIQDAYNNAWVEPKGN